MIQCDNCPYEIKCDNCPYYLDTPGCERFHAEARGERIKLEIVE